MLCPAFGGGGHFVQDDQGASLAAVPQQLCQVALSCMLSDCAACAPALCRFAPQAKVAEIQKRCGIKPHKLRVHKGSRARAGAAKGF